MKMYRSASHLAEHFEDYPLILFAFCQYDTTGGSIFPAVWNAMLAARIEGVGSALTSAFMIKADELKQVLGVPTEGDWVFNACVTFGYPTGRWGIAPRRPAHEVSFRNSWDGELGLEIPEPLWSPAAKTKSSEKKAAKKKSAKRPTKKPARKKSTKKVAKKAAKNPGKKAAKRPAKKVAKKKSARKPAKKARR